MTSLLQQRETVALALENTVFVLNDSNGVPVIVDVDVIQRGYRPIELIGEDMPSDKPRIMVIGSAYSDMPGTRNTKKRTLYLRCFMEQLVPRTLDSGIILDVDNMLRLTDQMMNACSGLNNWVGTNPAVDESNLPYMFHVLREKSLFQSIIHPSYLVHLDRNRR